VPSSDVFPLQTTQAAKAKRIRTLQHLGAAFLLIVAGVGHVRHGGAVLPFLEIAAGVLLIGSVVFERVKHHSGGGVAWVEFAGATMTLVEAFSRLEERHHLSFYVLSFVTPVIRFALAIFDAEVTALRRIKIDDGGFEMRLRAFFARRVAWRDVESWMASPDAIVFRMRNGREKTFKFRSVINREEAMDWAASRLAAKELPRSDRGTGERQQNEELVAGERRPE